jgi:hypothetical protein
LEFPSSIVDPGVQLLIPFTKLAFSLLQLAKQTIEVCCDTSDFVAGAG